MSVSQEFLNKLDATHHTYGARSLSYNDTEKLIRHLRENTFNNTERLNKLLQNEEGLSETNWMEAIRKYFWEQPGDYAEIIIKAGILEKPYHLKDKPLGEIKRLLKPITNASGYNFAVGKFNNNWSNSINYLRSSLNMSNGDYTPDVGRQVYNKLGYNRPSERGFYGSGYDPDHYFEPFYKEYVHYVDDLIWEKLNLDKKYAVEDSSPVWDEYHYSGAVAFGAKALGGIARDKSYELQASLNSDLAENNKKNSGQEGLLYVEEKQFIIRALERYMIQAGYYKETSRAIDVLSRGFHKDTVKADYKKMIIEVKYHLEESNPSLALDFLDAGAAIVSYGLDKKVPFLGTVAGMGYDWLTGIYKDNSINYADDFYDGDYYKEDYFESKMVDEGLDVAGFVSGIAGNIPGASDCTKIVSGTVGVKADLIGKMKDVTYNMEHGPNFQYFTDVNIRVANGDMYSYRFDPDGKLFGDQVRNLSSPATGIVYEGDYADLTIISYAKDFDGVNNKVEYNY